MGSFTLFESSFTSLDLNGTTLLWRSVKVKLHAHAFDALSLCGFFVLVECMIKNRQRGEENENLHIYGCTGPFFFTQNTARSSIDPRQCLWRVPAHETLNVDAAASFIECCVSLISLIWTKKYSLACKPSIYTNPSA